MEHGIIPQHITDPPGPSLVLSRARISSVMVRGELEQEMPVRPRQTITRERNDFMD